MQIEKINENKLKIIINVEDLNKKNISLQTFMTNSIKDENFLFGILDLAKEEIDFKFKGKKLSIQAFAIPSKILFVLIITTIEKANKDIKLSHSSYKKLTLSTSILCEFNCFEEFCMFCNSIGKNFNIKSSLFLLDNKYYLHITFNNIKDIKLIISFLYEFSSNVFINKTISENAKILIKANALEMSKKYFV